MVKLMLEYKHIATVIASVALIISAIQAYISYTLTRDLNKIEQINVRGYLIPSETAILTGFAPPGNPQLEITLMNNGNSTITILEHKVAFRLWSQDTVAVVNDDEMVIDLMERYVLYHGNQLSESINYEVHIDSNHMIALERPLGEKYPKAGFFYGKIFYRDIFDEEHYTQYCYTLREVPSEKCTIKLWGSYNKAM